MPKYRIFETDQYIIDLNNINKNIRQKIKNKIEEYVYPQISKNPYFGLNIKKLRDYSPETWRYRVGNYRLFYEINDFEKIVYLIGIELRKDAY